MREKYSANSGKKSRLSRRRLFEGENFFSRASATGFAAAVQGKKLSGHNLEMDGRISYIFIRSCRTVTMFGAFCY
jgi:hypothetical protein